MASPPVSPPHNRARSRSPPQPSKRDKRRNALHDRLHDLDKAFNSSRDFQFRQQIHGLQTEMALIAAAPPYTTEPLNDAPDQVARLVEQVTAGGQLPHDGLTGRWYSRFVQEINRAKEERDTELALLMVSRFEGFAPQMLNRCAQSRHREEFNRIKYEHDFKSHFAEAECDSLTDTVRERLVQSISSKKARLVREKEQLDLADTNALLLHPNQFSIANPASPSGLSSNRKTRHTRHRVELDDVSRLGLESGKRKRKAPADDEDGSPGRDGRSTPAERAHHNLSQHQTAASYSISSLFTEKELAMHSNTAHVAAVHFLAVSRKAKNGLHAAAPSAATTNSANGAHDDDGGSAPDNSADDTPAHVAPEMERTNSSSLGHQQAPTSGGTGFHATRSTRTNGGAGTGVSLLGELADKGGAVRPNLPYFVLNNYHSRPNGSGTAPPLPPLMPEEIDEDLERIGISADSGGGGNGGGHHGAGGHAGGGSNAHSNGHGHHVNGVMDSAAGKPPGWVDGQLLASLVERISENDDVVGGGVGLGLGASGGGRSWTTTMTPPTSGVRDEGHERERDRERQRERFGMLHPDFPPTMDVHLVRLRHGQRQS